MSPPSPADAADALEGTHLASLVARRAAATPDALFAIDAAAEDDGRAWSFERYRRACLGLAGALAARGVGPGTVVSWQLPTTLEALALAGALSHLGAVQNPILPFLREREVGFVARQLEPALLVVPPTWRGFDHAAMAEAVAREATGLEVALVDDLAREAAAAAESRSAAAAAAAAAEPPPMAPAGDDARWVFYTSGTTADPKGVRHTDASLAASARAMVERFALRPDDRVAFVFPLTHIGGVGWLLAGLMAGCAHIVVPVFEREATPAVLARHGMTLGTAGTVFHQAYLAAQRAHGSGRLFPAARAFPGGGAPRPPGLHREVARELGGVGIVSGYGMTECPIATLASVDDPDPALAGTEGRPTAGVQLRIVPVGGPDDGEAAPGEQGEIRVRGPQLCRGYVDASLDAEAFDARGFFHSGDLGHRTPAGHLVVTGRLKDVIVRKGENISAREVEDLLDGHPAVADVAVVGIPDPETGERALAVVVPADPAAPPDLAELVRFLRERGLAAQKLPERLEGAEALPRNAAGKVLKRELVARYGGGP